MIPFQYIRAENVHSALGQLSQPGAKALAGGTTLVDLMKLDVESPTAVVDIRDLPWKEISIGSASLHIGALCSNTQVAEHPVVAQHFPVIAQAILSGASGQIRNMATVGGNIMQRTRCPYFRQAGWACNKRSPGSGCSAAAGQHDLHAVLGVSDACSAVYPSDLAVALTAADASVVLVSHAGERTMPLRDFLLAPGATPDRETRLEHGELIKAIAVPLPDPPRGGCYLKLRDRAAFAFATVSVAASIRQEGAAVTQAAVALGGVGTIPWRSPAAEDQLVGREPSRASLESFCDALLAGATPREANRYKLRMARGAVSRVFEELGGDRWLQ
jgi:xanthine dehydrogenase YagS FAD-binding subunit